MACDPAYIRRTPIHVTIFVIEDVFVRHACPDKIAARGVQNTLWLTCGTGRVQNEQRIFRIHRLRIAELVHAGCRFVPPDIAATFHRDLITGVLNNKNLFDAKRVFERGVYVLLERDDFRTAKPLVSGNDDRGITVIDTPRKSFR